MRIFVRSATCRAAIEEAIARELRFIDGYPKDAERLLDRSETGECVVLVASPSDSVREIITALFQARQGERAKVGA